MSESTSKQGNQATLYFDSECPLCSAEMCKLANVKHDDLALVPINTLDISDTEKQAFYKELHLTTKTGQTLRGYDANIYAWQQTKGNTWYKWLAHVLALPSMSWVGKLGYRLWLVYYQAKRQKRVAHIDGNSS